MRFTLIFFGHPGNARAAGFRPDGTHPQDPELWAWWPHGPISPQRVNLMPLDRVYVTESTTKITSYTEQQMLNDTLMVAKRGGPRIWMDL